MPSSWRWDDAWASGILWRTEVILRYYILKLLIIDPNMRSSSPSMKGVIRSLPQLKAAGFQIEVWCWGCDEKLPIDSICRLPRWGNVRFIGMFIFAALVSWRAWWLFRVRAEPRPEVIYSIAGYLADCDVAHVHFSPFDWDRRQQSLGLHGLRDIGERLFNTVSLIHTRRYLQQTSARTVICVSEAVAEDVRQENAALALQVLPNSYDPSRFNLAVRDSYRAATRSQLGFHETNCVFVFVSTGHYRRKGFFLAYEALCLLHQIHPHIRFLVVGGTENRLAALKAELPTVPEWMIFTGMVTEVERYFAAADAFLFPSYSEAFALVEVEAAACGLPLFLTPHHGAEMILEDGLNGRSLPFEACGISDVLASFVEGHWRPSPEPRLKKALDMQAYAEKLTEILKAAARDE